MRRNFVRGTTNRYQKNFRNVLTIYMENFDQKKLKLDFVLTDLSHHFEANLVIFVPKCLFMGMDKS